jgi:hypothetical protein
MHNVSSGFKTAIKQPSRIISAKVVINQNTYIDDKIIELSYEDTSNPSNKFEIGTVSAAMVNLSLLGVNEVFETATFKPYIGLDVNGTVEWVPIGVFFADDVDRKKDVTKLTLFDGMIKLEQAYFSNLSFPATITNVVNEICTKTGFQFVGVLPNYSIEKPEGFTYREVVGFIAALCGGFAKFTRDGKLTIKSYVTVAETISPDHYIDYKKKKDRPYRIDKITCQAGENIFTKGVLRAGGSEVTFANPLITDAILTDVFNKLNGFEYLPAWFNAQGNPALECGDIITLNTADNEIIKVPVMKHKLKYQGGLVGEIDSEGESENNNQFNSGGSLSQKVDRVVYEQALINEALINRATIEDLRATNAIINDLSTTKANITDLIAANARIDSLVTNDLTAINGKITNLESSKANITELTAAVGRVGNLEVDIASINTLLAGNIGANNLAVGAIQAGSGIIAKGAIGDAEISSLSAVKINTGTLDTTKVTIAGPNGRMQIKGNKLQVFDNKSGTLYERIMLGIDDANNSALTLRGADGITVLLTQDGLTKAGFTDGYGKLDNDSLDPAKIDIQKVVTRINNGTTTISASKILLTDKTLDVSFKSLSDSVTSQGQTISSQSSQISALDSAIKLRVLDQTYQTDKQGLESRLSTAEASITTQAGQINLKADASVVYTKTEINTELGKKADSSIVTSLTTRVSSAEQNISALDGKIEQRVTTTTYTLGMAAKEDSVYKQTTAPAHAANRLWLDTSKTPNILYRSTGTAWVKATPTTAGEVGAYSSSEGSALAGRVTTAEATIVNQGTEISQRVKSTDYNGNTIASLINQTATTIKIQASKINLVGAVTVLSDITGNLGTITAGTVKGVLIEGATIKANSEFLGGKIRFGGSYGNLSFYNSNNAEQGFMTNGLFYWGGDITLGSDRKIRVNRGELASYPYGWNGDIYMGASGEMIYEIIEDDPNNQWSGTLKHVFKNAVRFDGHITGSAVFDNMVYFNGDVQGGTVFMSNWFRARGDSGFYFQDYGGGFQMLDNYWVRVYGNKSLLIPPGRDLAVDRIVGSSGNGDIINFSWNGNGEALDMAGDWFRWKASSSQYIRQNKWDGTIQFFANDGAKHVFYNNGTKSGGSIEVDNVNLGMSPIDSPQVLLEYIEFDIPLTAEGTKVFLDETYLKTIDHFAVFPNNGKVIEKGADYFIISGEGFADCRIVGERIDYAGVFYDDLSLMEDGEVA